MSTQCTLPSARKCGSRAAAAAPMPITRSAKKQTRSDLELGSTLACAIFGHAAVRPEDGRADELRDSDLLERLSRFCRFHALEQNGKEPVVDRLCERRRDGILGRWRQRKQDSVTLLDASIHFFDERSERGEWNSRGVRDLDRRPEVHHARARQGHRDPKR